MKNFNGFFLDEENAKINSLAQLTLYSSLKSYFKTVIFCSPSADTAAFLRAITPPGKTLIFLNNQLKKYK